jgi:hypothetical protein
MNKLSLYYVWWTINYLNPGTYGSARGAAVVAAHDVVEAREIGRPSEMWSGEVDAFKLTAKILDEQIGVLRVQT